MNDLMGLIYTGDNGERLGELTSVRAVAALPVLARYRVIDFVLSSLVSSGARNVGIILQKNYSSLIDHLGSGKEWDLHGKRQGLVFLPPYQTPDNIAAAASATSPSPTAACSTPPITTKWPPSISAPARISR